MNHTASITSLLLLALLAAGCGPKELSGPINIPGTIPFDIAVPIDLPEADYYIISGTKGEQQESQIGDSIIEVSIWRTYAQFYPAEGVPVDFEVWVNNTELQSHRDTDTLRLKGTADTAIRNGDQVWHIRSSETSEDLTSFVLPPVGLLDTISPLAGFGGQSGTIRSDTALTLRWKTGLGGNIRIEWITDGGVSVARDAQDFTGSYTFPSAVLTAVRGPCTVRITRFRSVTSEFNGRTIYALRLSQRIYRVNVQ